LGLPDSELMFFDTVLATDGVDGVSWVIANGFAETEAEAERRAGDRLALSLERLSKISPRVEPDLAGRRSQRLATRRGEVPAEVSPRVTKAAYLAAIERAKEHILAGDVFEICLSQRFDTEFAGSGLELYSALRGVNEAPMAAYLRAPECEVLSSSPERF